jgi:hypothetical protein
LEPAEVVGAGFHMARRAEGVLCWHGPVYPGGKWGRRGPLSTRSGRSHLSPPFSASRQNMEA